MSKFEDELASLEATRCPTCKGAGALDDADFGDIFYRTWKCNDCKGSGKKAEVQNEPTTIEVDERNEVTA